MPSLENWDGGLKESLVRLANSPHTPKVPQNTINTNHMYGHTSTLISYTNFMLKRPRCCYACCKVYNRGEGKDKEW